MKAVITGGGKGIGGSIAARLAADGASVIVGGRDLEALRETADRLGDAVHALPVDVTDHHSVEVFQQLAEQAIGVPDVVVCNSGISGPAGPLWELDESGWNETFNVNVTGTFRTLRVFLPGMIARGSGSVILVGSMTGKRPLAGRTPYAAAKLALVGLARTLALEAGPYGVRVNVVSPGFVAGTRLDWVIDAQAAMAGGGPDDVREQLERQIPLHRFVAADDVAAAVAFLAGDEARSVTGADINVTGGLEMH
ncbi:SDR family oxidoreductase [Kribbella sancticallisti]|uniref:SDR family oxidoreductase n=1 Tax=Kribbella sancticallisti TaxID=460087 RepID=A0ABP4PMD3_9ACTN